MRFILLFFLIVLTFYSYSQDVTTQNILYQSNKHTDSSIGTASAELTSILIKGKSKLEWRDTHNALKYSFDIKDAFGSLSLSKSGVITYLVFSGKISGHIAIKKTNAIITITAMLEEAGKQRKIDFEISGYTIVD